MSIKLPGPPPPRPTPPPPQIVVILINPTPLQLGFVFINNNPAHPNVTVDVPGNTSIYYSYNQGEYVLDPNSANGGFWMNI